MSDLSEPLRQRVREAFGRETPLALRGSGSKAFLGHAAEGEPLELGGHRGIVNHEPRELVLTARAGTPLAEIEKTLEAEGQMLPFEPPRFGPDATLGGTVACALSGPRRPYTGAVRDFVLGCRIINGRGEILRFGGEVMKNVAGYDISRLMAGAFGTLGILLEISLKVLPKPEAELTLVQECDSSEAIRLMNRWAGTPLPLSATSHDGVQLHLRLSGTPGAVRSARQRLGGEALENGASHWEKLREQRHGFFITGQPLWRLSVPPTAPPLSGLAGKQLLEWGGAQRWLVSSEEPERIRQVAAGAGGHATLYRDGATGGEVFHPLPPALAALHSRLRQAFDPAGILNRGRLHGGL